MSQTDSFRSEELGAPGFATVGELQDFLTDSGLVISLGTGRNEEFTVSERGATVADFLMLTLVHEGRRCTSDRRLREAAAAVLAAWRAGLPETPQSIRMQALEAALKEGE